MSKLFGCRGESLAGAGSLPQAVHEPTPAVNTVPALGALSVTRRCRCLSRLAMVGTPFGKDHFFHEKCKAALDHQKLPLVRSSRFWQRSLPFSWSRYARLR